MLVLKSLRVKFSLLILFILFIVFSISSGVLIYRNISTQRTNLISQARAFAKLSAKPIGSTYSLYFGSGYLKFDELIREILLLSPDIKKIQIISVTGEILFDSEDLETGKSIETKVLNDQDILDKINSNSGGETPQRTVNSTPDEIIEPYFEDFGAHPFSIRYFISYESVVENLLSTVVTTSILSAIFFIGSIVLLITVINRTILNPMEVVIKGSKRISRGDLSHKIEVDTKDEVSDLASAVNQMAQTLRKNIEDLKELDKLKDEFIFLASHNLRTPLAVIKGYVSSLLENKSLAKEVRHEVSAVETSTKQLETVTETLLSLVSLGKEEKHLVRVPVDLKKLLEQISGKLGKEAIEKEVSFIFELPTEPLPKIKLEKERIGQALTNLIDNAIKFNKKEGKVIIKLEIKRKEVIISIKDEGIGISEDEKDKVFKKFHRATDVLTYNYVGIGLGLSLTKLIVESHQGKIWFESESGKGSTFFVSLPINS